jgi:transposase
MPKLLQARPAVDAREAHQVRKLATSIHAPADWIVHAKMILRSWEGARTLAIAAELRCHAQTVRERIQAFNERGLEGLGMRPGGGRKPRLTELERSTILGLVKTTPPGKPGYERTGEFEAADERAQAPAEWTLDTLTAAARARHPGGAQPGALHLPARRRALAPHASLGHEHGCGLRPQRAQIVALYTAPPAGATVLCLDELGPVPPRAFPPAPGWSPDGHRIKAPRAYGRGTDKLWVSGALRVHDGQVLTQTAPARNTTGYLALLAAVEPATPTGDL